VINIQGGGLFCYATEHKQNKTIKINIALHLCFYCKNLERT